MSRPQLVAFDLDDTLAPSKCAIPAPIGDLLVRLAERVEVAIISGGQLEQFRKQVVEQLPPADAAVLERIHLLPTCGTQYYRLRGGGIDTVYAHALTEDERDRALAAVEQEARRLGLWESQTWGSILEDRGSQITFSALGITHRGIDKAYGMKQLADATGIALDDMLFVGDRLDPDGNDYPVLALGVPCHAVEGWEDTVAYLEDLIPTLG